MNKPPDQPSAPIARLQRIPLGLRMLVYGASFLGVVLGVLPWAAYQLDVQFPAARVEIGPLRWVGWALFAASLAVYLYSSFILSRRGRGAYVEFDPPSAFVATGPFAWSRNPIAGSLVLCVLGLALAFSSTGIFLLFLVGIPLAQIQVVYLEEPLLRRRFGTAYDEYVRTVPRWIPRPPRGAG